MRHKCRLRNCRRGADRRSTRIRYARRLKTVPMRVLMAAGGTGGHIFPALAVAEELRSRHSQKRGMAADSEWNVDFLGTGRGLEGRLIPAAGFPLHVVPTAGLVGMSGRAFLRNLLLLPSTFLQTARVLGELQPDVVLGVGGYVAGPVMLEAALRDIPTLLIEPNAVPGLTNRLLGPAVRVAAVGFDQAAKFYGTKACVTGHAVRRPFFEIEPKPHEPPFTILVVGGSQGSEAINRCVPDALPLIAPSWECLRLIHQTGERDYNVVCEAYRERGFPAQVHPFIDNMPEAFAGADLIISRSGAAAVAELAAAGRASILIPLPSAAEQHQLANARVMAQAGAARLIVQQELTPDRLAAEVRALLDDRRRLAGMEAAARRLSRPQAAERMADLVEQLAGSRPA
jgi:UDP-N-acetylglucosamine--N-acetylmuramyl-(pentapeptide) pyrophosphoryl-undecaprenol N-acetylglucosamine transferase